MRVYTEVNALARVQCPETNGVNNGDEGSATMNEEVNEEKENTKMSDDESSKDDEKEDNYHTVGDKRANEKSEPTVVQEAYK